MYLHICMYVCMYMFIIHFLKLSVKRELRMSASNTIINKKYNGFFISFSVASPVNYVDPRCCCCCCYSIS